jgi:hypothetical protein
MANYSTTNVKVFPSTYRKQVPQGKYTSENNFVNILNSLTDIDSYVISADNGVLKVVIHGYYFEISNFVIEPNLWLGIKIESGNNALVNFSKQSIDDLDSDNSFTGLEYFTSEPSNEATDNYTCYYLRVIKDSNIINKVKLTTDSIQVPSGKDLTDELDQKQYLLTNGQGIDTIDNNQNRVVKLTTTEYNKLSNLPNKGGSSTSSKLFYFNEDGIAVNNDKLNVGSRGSGTSKIESQGVYILDGTITAGQTFYASTDNPSGGNKGDI